MSERNGAESMQPCGMLERSGLKLIVICRIGIDASDARRPGLFPKDWPRSMKSILRVFDICIRV